MWKWLEHGYLLEIQLVLLFLSLYFKFGSCERKLQSRAFFPKAFRTFFCLSTERFRKQKKEEMRRRLHASKTCALKRPAVYRSITSRKTKTLCFDLSMPLRKPRRHWPGPIERRKYFHRQTYTNRIFFGFNCPQSPECPIKGVSSGSRRIKSIKCA